MYMYVMSGLIEKMEMILICEKGRKQAMGTNGLGIEDSEVKGQKNLAEAHTCINGGSNVTT